MTTINTRSTSRRIKRVRDDEHNYHEEKIGKRLKGASARDATKSVPRFLTSKNHQTFEFDAHFIQCFSLTHFFFNSNRNLQNDERE